jgi:hypothetical protein
MDTDAYLSENILEYIIAMLTSIIYRMKIFLFHDEAGDRCRYNAHSLFELEKLKTCAFQEDISNLVTTFQLSIF